MSTLPFLLSVADELDNLNSQSYMDDFGLGFHPHRHYYRNPSIQLSLPASTDWLEQKRNRCFKFVEENTETDADENNSTNENDSTIDDDGKKRQIDIDEFDNNDDGQQNVRRSHDNNDELLSINSQNLLVGKKDKNNRKESFNNVFQKMKQSPRNSNDSTNVATPNTITTGASSSSTDDFLSETSSIEFLTCFPMKKRKLLKSISSSRK